MGTMDEIIKFNNQTAGRDRFFRLVQYTSKIVWHSLSKRKASEESAEKVKRLDETLGLMRRLLRFGRFYESLHSALPVMSSVSDPVVRLTCVLSRICSTCFMLIDHIVCLDKLGILPAKLINAPKWDRTSTRFWLYSITLGLVRDFYEITRVYKEDYQQLNKSSRRISRASTKGKERHSGGASSESSANDGTGVNMVECLDHCRLVVRCVRDHGDVAVDTVKNLCDIFIPLNSLGFVKLNTATIGLLGVISSIVGALPQFNPMIKMVPST